MQQRRRPDRDTRSDGVLDHRGGSVNGGVVHQKIQPAELFHGSFDLEQAELCYAPQFGAAKDPVNMAGMIAANVLRGDAPLADWREVDDTGALVIDVREAADARPARRPDAQRHADRRPSALRRCGLHGAGAPGIQSRARQRPSRADLTVR